MALATLKDKASFNLLVDRYAQKIRRYIAHLIGNWQESEDLTQDVFFLAYKNIASFNPKMKFSAWLYRIAHNRSVNFIKKHYRFKHVEFSDTIQNELIEHIKFDEIIDQKINKKIIKSAIKKLASRDEEMIYLYYFEEKKYEEIADILEMPTNSIGPTLNRIKNKLRKILMETK